MKHIKKQHEPQEFLNWKNQANHNWQLTYQALSGNVKKTLKNALMVEQGYICCYCESSLSENDSHIEHLKPQSDPSVDSLDYSNLLCSCQSNLKQGEPRHCGNLKGDWFDLNLLVSPLDPACETRFMFTVDGYIHPAAKSDIAAATTIEKLGLDISKLRALRKSAIEPFLDGSLSPEDLQTFVSGYLQPTPNGTFREYWTTIRYLFEEYLP